MGTALSSARLDEGRRPNLCCLCRSGMLFFGEFGYLPSLPSPSLPFLPLPPSLPLPPPPSLSLIWSRFLFFPLCRQLQQQGILKSDDLITRFFRISVEMCVDLCYRTLSDPVRCWLLNCRNLFSLPFSCLEGPILNMTQCDPPCSINTMQESIIALHSIFSKLCDMCLVLSK